MRSLSLTIMLVLLTTVGSAWQGHITNYAELGGAADDTCWIKRMVNELYFRDQILGTSVSLSALITAGITVHDLLAGLADDDHPQYYNAERLNTKFGDTLPTTTVGADWTKGIATPPDPAGNDTLGSHTISALLHWHRPSRIVTVGKDDGNYKCQFTTVQAAIDWIPDASANKRYVILIHPGTYTAQVTLNKSYIGLVGVLGSNIMTPENLVYFSTTLSPTLHITATNPGPIVNICFEHQAVGSAAAVNDQSAACIFRNCKFKATRAVGYSTSSAGQTLFYDCLFSDAGASGAMSYSTYSSAASNRTFLFYRCFFSAIGKTDHVILRDAGVGAVLAELHQPRFSLGHADPATDGCFLLQRANSKVWLYSANFQTNAVIIHPSSTNGIIYYAHVQTENWGSPASGLTSSAIELSGGKFISDIDIRASLLMNGVECITKERDGYFRNLTATTATIAHLLLPDTSLTISELTVTTAAAIGVAVDAESYIFRVVPTLAEQIISMTAGSGDDGGDITLDAGNSADAAGGAIILTAGDGTADNHNGGNVQMNGGLKNGTGSDGDVVLANIRGRVGVKKSAPVTALDVAGTATVRGALIIDTTEDIAIDASQADGTYVLWEDSNLWIKSNGQIKAQSQIESNTFYGGSYKAPGHTNAILQTTDAAREVLIDSNRAIRLQLGDAAGARSVEIEDSGGVDVWTCNSDGRMDFLAGGSGYMMYEASNNWLKYDGTWQAVNITADQWVNAISGFRPKSTSADCIFQVRTDGNDMSFRNSSGVEGVAINANAGDVTIKAGGGIAIADTGTSGSGIMQIHAPTNINETLSANEQLAVGNVSQITGNAAWYFAFPVPTREDGKKVILKRLLIHVSDADGDDFVDSVILYEVTAAGVVTAVITDGTDRTAPGSYDIMSGDYRMADSCTYVLYVLGEHDTDNNMDVSGFRVDWFTAD